MRDDKYILLEDHSIEAVDLETWAKWFETADRKVRRTEYTDQAGERILISTVFLGLDHSFSLDGPPILFKTMVFGGSLDESQDRYATWDEAVAGHDKWVRKVCSTESGLSPA
jgi:hypothetical protein